MARDQVQAGQEECYQVHAKYKGEEEHVLLVVNLYFLHLQCTRTPVTLCGPRSCAVEKGEVECRKKMRTVSSINIILYPSQQPLTDCTPST